MTAKPLRRLRDFPEIMAAEHAAILDHKVTEPIAVLEVEAVVKATRAVCGADHIEIHGWINEATFALADREGRGEEVGEEAWDRAEAQDEERLAIVGRDILDEPKDRSDAAMLAFYHSIGWDPLNEYGQVLRIAANLAFPFLAASKSAGPARFPEEGTETARIWAEKVAARPQPKIRSAPTPVLTEEESRRRNAEARNSTVWRPNSKK
jgi:hypothetical protein